MACQTAFRNVYACHLAHPMPASNASYGNSDSNMVNTAECCGVAAQVIPTCGGDANMVEFFSSWGELLDGGYTAANAREVTDVVQEYLGQCPRNSVSTCTFTPTLLSSLPLSSPHSPHIIQGYLFFQSCKHHNIEPAFANAVIHRYDSGLPFIPGATSVHRAGRVRAPSSGQVHHRRSCAHRQSASGARRLMSHGL